MPPLLTAEERHTVLLCLNPAYSNRGRWTWYAFYIVPSLLFAGYSLFNQDYVAALVAYIALLIPALMYLSRNFGSSDHLRTALEKYEAKVGALSPQLLVDVE
jgi:hypothetical protein